MGVDPRVYSGHEVGRLAVETVSCEAHFLVDDGTYALLYIRAPGVVPGISRETVPADQERHARWWHSRASNKQHGIYIS